MPHLSEFTLLDASGEKSLHKMYNGAITAVSIGGFLTEFGAYRTALDAIVMGTVQQEAWIGDRTVLSNTPPTAIAAQREFKILVTYRGDTTNKLYNLEIATPDFAVWELADPGNSDALRLDQPTAVTDWVAAFEQLARTPDDDVETVTIVSARLVGRNI